MVKHQDLGKYPGSGITACLSPEPTGIAKCYRTGIQVVIDSVCREPEMKNKSLPKIVVRSVGLHTVVSVGMINEWRLLVYTIWVVNYR